VLDFITKIVYSTGINKKGVIMTYTKEQKKIARDKLKAIGYKLSISMKYSPFSGVGHEFVYIILPNGKKVECSECNCLSVEFYEEHKAAFAIVNELKKEIEKS